MKHNALFSSALLIAGFATYSSLHASALDPKFDYQLYLDFALNKGQFAPNTQNIFIPAKDSSHLAMQECKILGRLNLLILA